MVIKSCSSIKEEEKTSVLPVLVTIRCTCTPAFCRELTGRPPAALEPAIPMATWRGIIGMGVDWMGLTLATGLSSPRTRGRLQQTQGRPGARESRRHNGDDLSVAIVGDPPASLVERRNVGECLAAGGVVGGVRRARVGHRGSLLVLVALFGCSLLSFGQFRLLAIH